MAYEFSRIEEALEAIAEGRVVIVVDDDTRENEGDFVVAAEKARMARRFIVVSPMAKWANGRETCYSGTLDVCPKRRTRGRDRAEPTPVCRPASRG